MTGHKVAAFTLAQIVGGSVGAVLANVMFDRRAFEASLRYTGAAQNWS
jgi:glycerol uptake facilitator-like aquaporin